LPKLLLLRPLRAGYRGAGTARSLSGRCCRAAGRGRLAAGLLLGLRRFAVPRRSVCWRSRSCNIAAVMISIDFISEGGCVLVLRPADQKLPQNRKRRIPEGLTTRSWRTKSTMPWCSRCGLRSFFQPGWPQDGHLDSVMPMPSSVGMTHSLRYTTRGV